MNELATLFHRLGLDIREVLKAARTKWNFLPFEPGLVGGHCIPVDPYYLTHKAQEVGFHPEVILAGRRINDSMGVYVAQETIKLLIEAGRSVRGASVLVLGVTFKENVRDVRNSRVVELVRELENYGVEVSVHDPIVGAADVQKLGLRPISDPFSCFPRHPTPNPQPPTPDTRYDAVVLAVPHRAFCERTLSDYLSLLADDGRPVVFVDVKAALPLTGHEKKGRRGVLYWSL
jgi:UDP-N-acetyl-D-galactosamine dehydrogenase